MELYKCKIVIIHVKKDDGQIDKNVTKHHVVFLNTLWKIYFRCKTFFNAYLASMVLSTVARLFIEEVSDQKFVQNKGQLISKCLFGVFNFSQKTKKTSRPEVS